MRGPSGTNHSQARTSCSCVCIWSLSSRPAILLCAECQSVASRARPHAPGSGRLKTCVPFISSQVDSFCPSQLPLETRHSLFPPSHSEVYFLHFPWYFLWNASFSKLAAWPFLLKDRWKQVTCVALVSLHFTCVRKAC